MNLCRVHGTEKCIWGLKFVLGFGDGFQCMHPHFAVPHLHQNRQGSETIDRSNLLDREDLMDLFLVGKRQTQHFNLILVKSSRDPVSMRMVRLFPFSTWRLLFLGMSFRVLHALETSQAFC